MSSASVVGTSFTMLARQNSDNSQDAGPHPSYDGLPAAAALARLLRGLTIQQVLLERLDHLKPGLQLTLKVASVMGQQVELDFLAAVHPLQVPRSELHAQLVELQELGFLNPTASPDMWEFHTLDRDVVYDVLPYFQKRKLHRQLALTLEDAQERAAAGDANTSQAGGSVLDNTYSSFANESAEGPEPANIPSMAAVAYHWSQACLGCEAADPGCAIRAMESWALMGEEAQLASSYAEALRAYQQAAAMAELLAQEFPHKVMEVWDENEGDDGDDSGYGEPVRRGQTLGDGVELLSRQSGVGQHATRQAMRPP
eukprot:jgi/Chrzof1/10072/Cz04g26030.t1